MVDISVNGLIKEYEVGRRVLDGLTFQVDSGERVGILGRNGAGKTTLFRILTGEEAPDDGEIAVASRKRLGLISQIPVYPIGFTVENVLCSAFDSLFSMEAEIRMLTAEMAGHPNASLMRRYDSLINVYQAEGGYEIETRLGKVCNGLSISPTMREKAFDSLSGGEKTRINLARLILVDTDILLLDEPTNHLDLNATQWLEEFLSKYKGTVLTISHDRYFLDRVISRAIELKDGKAEFYQGNYSFYAVEKEKRYLEKLRQYEKEQAKLAQLQEAADKLHLWAFMGNDKLHKRAFSIEKRMEKLKSTDRPMKERTLSIKFGEREFRGDDLLQLWDISKSYEEQNLFDAVDLKIEDGDRIALLGDNGTGKSTLLKIITGEIQPDGGRIKQGPTVKVGYLPQQISFSHPERSLLDTMLYELNCSAQEARDRLAAFEFRGEDVFKQVSALSGGEQSRLRLCMLMDSRINFLILDEPTNHLDLASREWIEAAVEDFEGTVLFVSHDRYFIDRFATRIWTLENGYIQDFRGNYQGYQIMRERINNRPAPKKHEKWKNTAPAKRYGGTKNFKKELSLLEKRMEKLDGETARINEQKEKYATDYHKLEELTLREAEIMGEYAQMMDQWEELSLICERMESKAN